MIRKFPLKQVSRWIKDRVAEGLDWKAIRDLLRVDEDSIAKAETGDEFPLSLHVDRQDVYNEIRKALCQQSRLALDGEDSLHQWAEQLRGKGHKVLFKMDVIAEGGRRAGLFAWSSPWQQEVGPVSALSLSALYVGRPDPRVLSLASIPSILHSFSGCVGILYAWIQHTTHARGSTPDLTAGPQKQTKLFCTLSLCAIQRRGKVHLWHLC